MVSDRLTSNNRLVFLISRKRLYLSFRWLILGIFLIPFFIKDSPLLASNGDTFIALSIVSIISCAILLSRLDRPFRQTLWVWVILFILISGYFLKTYYFVNDFSQLAFFLPEWRRLSIDNIVNGFTWSVLAFITFCLVSWLILGLYKNNKISKAVDWQRSQPGFVSIKHIFVIWVFCISATTLISLFVMNNYVFVLAGNNLPSHVETLFYFLQNHLIPGVLLLTVWLTWRKKRIWQLTAIGLLLFHFILWGVAYTSRGGLITFALYIGILWVITNRFTKKHAMVLAALVVITILFVYPLMSIMRAVRIQFGESPAETWQKTVEVFRNLDPIGVGRYYTVSLMWRVTGVDGVWFTENHLGDYSVLRLILDPRREKIYKYYSNQVIGLINPLETRPPGLVAAGMLLGGVPGVVLLWIGSIIFLWILWRWVARFRAHPVLLAQCGVYIWIFVMAGMLEYRHFVYFVVTALICEALYRFLLRPSRSIGFIRSKENNQLLVP